MGHNGRLAPVAQGIEHWPPKPGVAGSNPAGRALVRNKGMRIPAGAEPSVAELDALDFFVRGVVGDVPE